MTATDPGAAGSDERSTRDLILDVAEARFAERGFAGVSVREIAADAGLKNQASLYHHFRNKRSLYEAILGRGITTIVNLVMSPDAADDPRPAGLTSNLDRLVDYLVDHPQLPRLIQRAGLDDTRYLRSALTHILRPLYAKGMEVLAAAHPGSSPEELVPVAAGIYHLIFGYFASARLLEAVTRHDPLTAAAVARQRRFLKAAVGQLLSASGDIGGRLRD